MLFIVNLNTCKVPKRNTGVFEGPVAVESVESGGNEKKFAVSAMVRYVDMSSVVRKHITILQTGQNRIL